MRSAERFLAVAGLLAAGLLLAGCATLEGLVGEPAPKPSAPPAAPAVAAVEAKAAAKPVAEISPATQRAFDAARQALAAGRTAEAERGFVALTKAQPELSGPYANLALIQRQAGRNAEATAALEKAVQLSPGSAELHNQLGVTYRMGGEFAKAKASYERAIALNASYAPAVLNLGILYDLYLWDGARALELYDRYLQLTPGGDAQVQRWVSDLRNRTAVKSAPQRKEQG